MKKSITVLGLSHLVFALLCGGNVCAAPAPLTGVWRGSYGNRYVAFDGDNVCVNLLVYDRWYCDRTAEPLSYKESAERTRNSATFSEAEHISAAYNELVADTAWEINAAYGNRAGEHAIIPVAVIDGDIYLDFAIKAAAQGAYDDGVFYCGVRGQDAIYSCPMPSNGEIRCYYVTNDATYRLRYWPIDLTASEMRNAMATFNDDGAVYSVPAQVVSLGRVFTCVTGRSTKIRNIERLPAAFLNGKKSADGNVIALSAPSFARVGSGKDEMNTLLRIASEANSRRAPPPPPLLPPSSVDWHIELINNLENGNAVISAVRERSKQFSEMARGTDDKGK